MCADFVYTASMHTADDYRELRESREETAQAAAVALPGVTAATPWLVLSSLVVGAAVPGIVPLVLGRVHELLPDDPEAQRAAWSVTTMSDLSARAVPQITTPPAANGFALALR